jgi:hypothetical protein
VRRVSREEVDVEVAAASWACARARTSRRPARLNRRSAARVSFTLTVAVFEAAMRKLARPNVTRPRVAFRVSRPRQEPLVPAGQRSRTRARPERSTFAVRLENLMPANAGGAVVLEPPGAFEVFGAFGVGMAATIESSDWRWSDSPFGGTGPLADPVPIEFVGTALVMGPQVRQLKAVGLGVLASKHACPAPEGSVIPRRSSPATPNAASAPWAEIRYSRPAAAAAQASRVEHLLPQLVAAAVVHHQLVGRKDGRELLLSAASVQQLDKLNP